MGIDLTLHPIKFAHLKDWWLLTESLSMDRDYALYDQIKNLGSIRANIEGRRIQRYEDDGLKEIIEDAYGSPLHYVLAGQLATILPESDWNKAIVAFLKALPPSTPVLLYWH